MRYLRDFATIDPPSASCDALFAGPPEGLPADRANLTSSAVVPPQVKDLRPRISIQGLFLLHRRGGMKMWGGGLLIQNLAMVQLINCY